MASRVGRWWLAGANDWGAKLGFGDPGDRGSVRVEGDGVRRGARVLTLAVGPGGPLDPAAAAATAGGLAVPTNVHVDESGEIVLAAARRGLLLRLDREAERARPWIGLEPLGPGPAEEPAPILLDRRGELVVAARIGSRRAVALHPGAGLVFDAVSLPGRRRLADLAAVGREVLLLASVRAGPLEVWSWSPGRGRARRTASLPTAPRPRSPSPGAASGGDDQSGPPRLVLDGRGRPYAFDGARGGWLLPLSPEGAPAGEWEPLEARRDDFAPLPVVVEADPERGWRLRLPPAGTRPPHPWPAPPAWPAFGPEGRRLRPAPDAPVGPPPFRRSGTFEVGPLDGGLPRARWERIELELDDLSAGTAVRIETRSADAPDTPARVAPWSEPHVHRGREGGADPSRDFAVLAPPGRFLWIRLGLEGGAATPRIRSVTAVRARSGLVDYLPLVFREADREDRFLERLVGALERTFAPLEEAVSSFDRQLRPETAGPDMLPYLASWFDEPVDPDLGAPGLRRVVDHGRRHLFRRGTPGAVQAALRLFLANRWGYDTEDLAPAPFLWEHFRSRAPVRSAGGGRVGEDGWRPDAEGDVLPPEPGPGRLFGTEVLRRLRLDASELGEGTLRDLGSPSTDPVTLHANRVTVFLPRALAPTDDDVRGLRNTLTREQPAAVSLELRFVHPRMRVGRQATLGVDTILGIYPVARLAAPTDGGDDAPPARLDFDCLLADGETPLRPEGPPIGDAEPLPWRIT